MNIRSLFWKFLFLLPDFIRNTRLHQTQNLRDPKDGGEDPSLSTGEELDHWLLNYCLLIRSLIQKKQIDNNVVLAENAMKIVKKKIPESGAECGVDMWRVTC